MCVCVTVAYYPKIKGYPAPLVCLCLSLSLYVLFVFYYSDFGLKISKSLKLYCSFYSCCSSQHVIDLFMSFMQVTCYLLRD